MICVSAEGIYLYALVCASAVIICWCALSTSVVEEFDAVWVACSNGSSLRVNYTSDSTDNIARPACQTCPIIPIKSPTQRILSRTHSIDSKIPIIALPTEISLIGINSFTIFIPILVNNTIRRVKFITWITWSTCTSIIIISFTKWTYL